MGLEEDIGKLAALGHRLSGTPNDRAGARLVFEGFAAAGLEVREESFLVPGHYGQALTLNLVAVLLAGATFPIFHWWAVPLFAIALISLWGEMTFQYHLLRRIIPRHVSSNIEARLASPGAGKNVIILAHHDSPRAGLLWHEKIAGGLAPRLVRLPAPLNRFFLPPFAAAALLGGVLTLRLAHVGIPGAAPVAVAAAVVVILSLVMNFQWSVSPPSPGGNDNGSGLLVLLELARRLKEGDAPPINVRLVATGAEETGFFGIKRYLRNNDDLGKDNSLFINIESVGGGELHWAVGEAFLTHVRYPKTALTTLEALEKQSAIPSLPRTSVLAPTDGLPLARAGMPVLTMIGLREGAIPPRYHRLTDTFESLDRRNLRVASEIIERMARGLGGLPENRLVRQSDGALEE
jgi:hypothetical protein